jgi:hypothetical protein
VPHEESGGCAEEDSGAVGETASPPHHPEIDRLLERTRQAWDLDPSLEGAMTAIDEAIAQVPPDGWPELEMVLFVERAEMFEQSGLRWCAVADLRAACALVAAAPEPMLYGDEDLLLDIIERRTRDIRMSDRLDSDASGHSTEEGGPT